MTLKSKFILHKLNPHEEYKKIRIKLRHMKI